MITKETWRELNIFFKITTRERPAAFKKLVENIISKCAQQNYFIQVTADVDDAMMYNDDIQEYCTQRNILLGYGASAGKVHAINRDMTLFDLPDWHILVNVSDDMEFIDNGFDIVIRKEFAHSLDAFVHFPDNNRSDICTLSILGRDYFERFKYIYYPAYTSLYCDQDATQQAKELGCYRYNPLPLIRHRHPAYGTAEWDDLYSRNESPDLYTRDGLIFQRRRQSRFLDETIE